MRRRMRAPFVSPFVGLLVALLVTLDAAPARACGGLFCSSQNPTPVDQNAERILFEIDDDGSVTATVEIKYSGDPSNFSWIIPVPETPVVEVADANALAILDNATTPQLTRTPTSCARSPRVEDAVGILALPFFIFGGADCADDSFISLAGDESQVNVEALPSVGPYGDIVVVDSPDADALADWLIENDYVVTEAMRPLLRDYAADGYKFLALKLAPDAGVGDIAPLRFTCPGQDGTATLPLRLTALSAEPEMSVLVFIAGPERYRPVSWRDVELDENHVRYSTLYGTYNYFALVSWLVDEAGGQGFVTEQATPMATVLDQLDVAAQFTGVDTEPASTLLDGHAFLTRLYTRASGWEMATDPTFAAGGDSVVNGGLNLSNQPPEDLCEAALPAPRCGDTYCGVGSSCAATSDGDGCVCEGDTSARAILAPDGTPTVHCQDRGVDFLADVALQQDVCANAGCGNDGRCVAVNGFPTCECDGGFAAVPAVGGSGLRCRTVVETYPPSQLLWPDRDAPAPGEPGAEGGCASAALPAGGFLLWWLGVAAILALWGRLLRRWG